jgi:hypothetical protein
MPSCFLRAIGETFDVRRFLADSTLRPDVHPKGFNLAVGQAGFDDLPGQVREAMAFLDVYEDELRRLSAFEGVDQVFLDFGLRLRDVAAQTDVLPAELLWRAGALDIDITVTHYAIADEKH